MMRLRRVVAALGAAGSRFSLRGTRSGRIFLFAGGVRAEVGSGLVRIHGSVNSEAADLLEDVIRAAGIEMPISQEFNNDWIGKPQEYCDP